MASNLDPIIIEKGPKILEKLEERFSVAQIIEPEKFDKFAVLSEILGYTARLIGARYIGISEVRLVPGIGKQLQNIDDGVFYNKERFLALARSIDETLSDQEKLNAHPLFYQEIDVYWYAPDCEIMVEGEERMGPLAPNRFFQMRGSSNKVFNEKEIICLCKNEDYMTKLLLDDASGSKYKNYDDYLIYKLKDYVSDMVDLGKISNPEKIDYGIALSEFREFIKGLDLSKRYSSQQGIDFNYVLRSNSSIVVPIIAFDATKNEEVVLGGLEINDIPEWDLEPLSSDAMAMLGKIAGKVAPSIAQAYQAHQWKVINGKLDRAYTDLRNAQAAIILQEKLSSLGMLSASIAHGVHNPLFALSVSTRRLEELTNRIWSDWQKLESQGLSVDDRMILQETLATVGRFPATPPTYLA